MAVVVALAVAVAVAVAVVFALALGKCRVLCRACQEPLALLRWHLPCAFCFHTALVRMAAAAVLWAMVLLLLALLFLPRLCHPLAALSHPTRSKKQSQGAVTWSSHKSQEDLGAH